jgi:hypothetical protein
MEKEAFLLISILARFSIITPDSLFFGILKRRDYLKGSHIVYDWITLNIAMKQGEEKKFYIMKPRPINYKKRSKVIKRKELFTS